MSHRYEMNELDLGSGEMLMLLPNISLINSKSEVRFFYIHASTIHVVINHEGASTSAALQQ